jgi:hypothetical protein
MRRLGCLVKGLVGLVALSLVLAISGEMDHGKWWAYLVWLALVVLVSYVRYRGLPQSPLRRRRRGGPKGPP